MGKVVGTVHQHDYPVPDFSEMFIGVIWQCACHQLFALRGHESAWHWETHTGFWTDRAGNVNWVRG